MNTSKLVWLALCGALAFAGCSRKEASFEQLFSPVYQKLTPDIWKSGAGAEIREKSETGSWNPKTEDGTRQVSGILSVSTSQTNRIGVILKAVELFVQSKTGRYHAEGDIPSTVTADQQHTHTTWMYNWNTRHGELDVWLFPFPDGERIAFVIHHREERLK